MHYFILDKSLKTVAIASTDNSSTKSFNVLDDKYTEYSNAPSILEITFDFFHEKSLEVKEGAYIAFELEGKTKLLQIKQVEETHGSESSIVVYAEESSYELLDSIVFPHTYNNQSLEYLLEICLNDTDWIVGETSEINVETFEFESYNTALSQVQKLAEETGCILNFHVDFNPQKGVTRKYVDLVEKVNVDEGKRLEFGVNVDSIKRIVDRTEICTAVIPIGENDTLVTGFDWTNYYDDKTIKKEKALYYLSVDEDTRMEINPNSDLHLFHALNVDSSDKSTLCQKAYEYLKNHKKPKYTYEANAIVLKNESYVIGEQVKIIDDELGVSMIAEVEERTLSFSNPDSNGIVLTNYIEKKSNISQDFYNMQSKLQTSVLGNPLIIVDTEAPLIEKVGDKETIWIDTSQTTNGIITLKQFDSIASDWLIVQETPSADKVSEDISTESESIKTIVTEWVEQREIAILKGDTFPQSGLVGQLFINTSENGNMYRWDGAQWVLIADIKMANDAMRELEQTKEELTQTKNDLSESKAQLEQKITTMKEDLQQSIDALDIPIVESATAPTDTTVLWKDTNSNQLYLYINGEWEQVTNTTSDIENIVDAKTNIIVDDVNGQFSVINQTLEQHGETLSKTISKTTYDTDMESMNARITTNSQNITANSEAISTKLDASTYTTDKATYESKFESYDNQFIQTAKDISAKLDANTYQSDKSGLNTTLAEMKNNITINAQGIEGKVSQTTYDTKMATLDNGISGLETRMSTAEGNITANAREIGTKLNETQVIEKFTEEAGKLNVGGRNYLLNATFTNVGTNNKPTNWDVYPSLTSWIVNENDFNGNNSFEITNTSSTSSDWRGATQYFHERINLAETKIKKFTFSGFVYVFDDIEQDCTIAIEIKGRRVGEISHSPIGDCTFAIDCEKNKWIKFSKTIEFVPNEWDKLYYYFWIQKNGHCKFSQLKVEEGNFATTFTIAPEDYNGEVDSLSERIESNYSSIQQLSGSITSMVSKEVYEQDKTTMTNRIESAENTITQTADNINATITTKVSEEVQSQAGTIKDEILDQVNSDYTDFQNRLEIAENNITANSKSISAKLDASTYTSDKNGLNQTLTTMKNNISANTSGLSGKLSSATYQTDEETRQAKFEYLEGQIALNAQGLSAKFGSTEVENAITNKLDSLKIGGTNLLENSSFSESIDRWSGSTSSFSIVTEDNLPCAKVNLELGKTKTLSQSIFEDISGDVHDNSNDSQLYTFSVDVKLVDYVAGTTNKFLSLYVDGNYNNNGTNAWLGSTGVSGDADISRYNNKGWKKVVYTFKLTKIPTSMYAYIYCRDCTGTLYFKNAKLEKGNKATDWSPSPLDIELSLEDVSGKVANNTLEIEKNAKLISEKLSTSTYETDQATLSAKLAGYESVHQQTSKDIANRVTKTEFEALDIGGENLFQESGHWTTVPKWLVSNGGGLTLDTSVKYLGYNTLRTTVGSGIVGNKGSYFEIDPNKTYTYSAMIKSSGAYSGTSATPLHYHCSSDGSSNSAGITIIKYDQKLVANEWKLCYLTFKPNGKYFRPYIYIGSSPSLTLNIAYLKLETGNKPTDWNNGYGDISKIETRLTTAEQKITQDAIVNTVKTSTTFNSYIGSMLEQTRTDINMNFANASGRNMLTNSCGYSGIANGWNFNNTYVESVNDPDTKKLGVSSSFHMKNSTTSSLYYYQLIDTVIGQTYTYSAYVKVISGGLSWYAHDPTYGRLSTTSVSSSTNGYYRIHGSFTAKSYQTRIYFGVNKNSEFYATKCMVNVGTELLDWSNHPSEIHNDNVNFSSNGIRVSRNNSDGKAIGYTVMSHDEFAGYADTNGNGSYEKIFYLDGDATMSKRVAVTSDIVMGDLKAMNFTTSTSSGWIFLPSTSGDKRLTDGIGGSDIDETEE